MLTQSAVAVALAHCFAHALAPAPGQEPQAESRPANEITVGEALTVDADDSCLEHDRLAERIVLWLRRGTLDPRLTISVEEDPQVHGVRYEIRSDGDFVSERRFEWTTKDCADRHYVFALSIAMALDATVLQAVSPNPMPPVVEEDEPLKDPPKDPPPPQEPPFDPVLDEPVAAEPGPSDPEEDTPRPKTHVRLGARGLFAIGTPTGLGGGAEVALELGWRELIDIDTRLLVTTTGEQSFAGGRFTSTSVAGRFNVCAGPQLGRVRPRACTGVLSGVVHAQGREFRRQGRARLPWVAFVLGGNVRVKLTSRLGLDFALEGVVTALKPIFVVESDAGPSEREFARFGVTAGIGLSIQLR